jgi:AraC family transcriptional regulator
MNAPNSVGRGSTWRFQNLRGFSNLVAGSHFRLSDLVRSTPATHIGEGKPALIQKEFRREWTGLELIFRRDDISQPTDWCIQDPRHAVVVHLGGHMRRLETEVDGFGGSCGPALPGEVWTAPAGRKYASHACGTAIHYAVLRVEPNALDLVAGSNHGRRELAVVAGVRDDLLHRAVLRLITAAPRADDISEMEGRSLSLRICLHLFRALAPAGAAPSRPQSSPSLGVRKTRALREFIFDHLGQRITLADLASLSGVTTHHLLIAFRKAFGSTPAQYIIRQRLRHAQRQLVHTKKDITTIAFESGFSSHSHLTACFNKHVGTSPSQFRKTIQVASADFSRIQPKR